MTKSLSLLVFAALISQAAFATDPWDTLGRIRLDRLGNLEGKQVRLKQKFDCGISNTPEFQKTHSLANVSSTMAGVACTLTLGDQVEIPGVLERIFLGANTYLTPIRATYTTDPYKRPHLTFVMTMLTDSQSEVTLTCSSNYQSSLLTLKNLQDFLVDYFDFSSLLPQPPADRQAMDFDRNSEDRNL